MTSTRSRYDTTVHNKHQDESLKVGMHGYNTPLICNNCVQTNPNIVQQKGGVSLNTSTPWRFNHGPVDIESDLRNNSDTIRNDCRIKLNHNTTFSHFKDCYFPTDDTRLSNPSCNLRGTEINRFAPLQHDPQDNVLFSGAYLIPSRTVMRDNHRPICPSPAVNSLDPNMGQLPCNEITGVCESFTGSMHPFNPPSRHLNNGR
jgi:hypothetical protein